MAANLLNNNIMRVFVTGATGFVGSAVVQELLGAGHQVLGLARSEEAAQALTAAGAEAHRGSLDDLDRLQAGVAATEGVIHLGFIHDFANFAAAAQTDKRAIEAMGEALVGSDRPLVVTSGLAGLQKQPGQLATEESPVSSSLPRVSEATALALAAKGVRASVVRLSPTVHGTGDQGFVPALLNFARQKGVAVYSGDGANRWAAVHRVDAARLFRLALEQGRAGACYHGVAEEGIPMRDIVAVIGRHLQVPVESKSPEEAASYLQWLAYFAGLDMSASSALTQQQLGWHPTQPGLLADMEAHYFGS